MQAQTENLRVLLVEDQFFMRNLWRTILKGMGIRQVWEAGDLAEAHQALRKESFHLAIVDYHLGADGTGADLIRQIRTSDSPVIQLMSIIGCTSDTRSEVISELVSAGAHGLVAKPVSAEAAKSRIRSVLEKRQDLIRRGVNRAAGRPDDAELPGRVAAAK